MGTDTTNEGSGLGLVHASMPAAGDSQTDWSMVFRAAIETSSEGTAALDQLARRYWPAMYAFIRSTGRDIHEAADLTQGFVCDVLLMRKLLASADPKRGRFRTLLLSALKNYLHDEHRRATRLKRSAGGVPPLHLDHAELSQTAVDPGQSPDQAFSAQWGATLLSQVLEQVRQSCLEEELDLHWRIFEERILLPILFGQEATPYPTLVERYTLRDASQAANMVITVKRRIVRELLQEVRRTVEEPALVEQELRDLLGELERPR